MQTKTEINKYKTNTSQLPLTLTVTDLAKVLGIGKAYAYDLCNSGDIPSVKIGKGNIIPKQAFIDWLYDNEKEKVSRSAISQAAEKGYVVLGKYLIFKNI